MTMSIISPVTLTDAMLVSSTAPETDYAAWNAATNYTIGTKVIRTTTHRIYENLIAGVDATLPENATTGVTPRWLEIAPTNRWAMFDNKIGTVTTLGTSPLTVVLQPGLTSGVALLELTGEQVQVTMKDAPAGTVVYNKTITLDGRVITSFYEWFFTDYVQLTDVTLSDLPGTFSTCELTISITSASTVACGVCHVGKSYPLGSTQYGASVGVISYSKKTTDDFGNTTVVKRANSKRNSLQLITEKVHFNRTYRLLASLDSVPCVYTATELPGYEPLIVYGFWRDFSIDVAYPTYNLTNIEIEGLI